MPIVEAPRWGGAQTGTQLYAGAADRDARMGSAFRMAAWEQELAQRARINALLRRMAEQRMAQKAAQEQSGWGSIAGAGAGAIAGAVLAPFTGGLSLLPAAAMGAGLGGTIGGAVDQSMGRPTSNIGPQFLGFSAEFLEVDDNPYFQQGSSTGYKIPAGGSTGDAVGLGS